MRRTVCALLPRIKRAGMQFVGRKRGKPALSLVVDSPCWGSPTCCSLEDLLRLVRRSEEILIETDQYLVLNKPPDLRMDGDYPCTVIKLLTYWYPPESLKESSNLLDAVSSLSKLNNMNDNQLRPCHQLDYATSGVLLIGRTSIAASIACEAFRERTPRKEYLAVVHSHLQVDAPILSLTLKDVYCQIRAFDQKHLKRGKHGGNTFNGFQPASSIFLKWKSFHRKGAGKRPRDDDMFHALEAKLSKTDIDELGSLTSWSQVKLNSKWKTAFEQGAATYNEALKVEADQNASKPPELPTVFRLEEDKAQSVFYVNASLAHQPNEFAMKIHASAALNMNKDSDTKTMESTELTFKLAITKCAILQHTHLQGSPVTKMALQPLTGRRHQLRCHMATVNASIVGDATYETSQHPRISQRMCLHAHRLMIPNVVEAEAPDPFLASQDGSLKIKCQGL